MAWRRSEKHRVSVLRELMEALEKHPLVVGRSKKVRCGTDEVDKVVLYPNKRVEGRFPKNPVNKETTVIGGTKNIRKQRIIDMNPCLVLGNKEENVKEDIAYLEKQLPVWISDVNNLEDGLMMMELMGEIFNRSHQASSYISSIQKSLPTIEKKYQGRSAYLIWKAPYMSVGGDTYIHSWLEYLGFENVFSSSQRYPTIEIKDLIEKKVHTLFLPDEPYVFKEEDRIELQKELPNCKIILVDGAQFTWYGSQMDKAIRYLSSIPL